MKKLLFLLLFLLFAAPAFAQFPDQRQYAAASGGSGNAQTLAIPNYNLNVGVVLRFIPGFTNTGPVTLTVNGGVAKALLKASASGLVPLAGGELVPGAVSEVVYDGTRFELLNFLFAAPTPGGGNTCNVQTAYGALGNGVNNDLPAIQSCINAVAAQGGGTVYLPGTSVAQPVSGGLTGATVSGGHCTLTYSAGASPVIGSTGHISVSGIAPLDYDGFQGVISYTPTSVTYNCPAVASGSGGHIQNILGYNVVTPGCVDAACSSRTASLTALSLTDESSTGGQCTFTFATGGPNLGFVGALFIYVFNSGNTSYNGIWPVTSTTAPSGGSATVVAKCPGTGAFASTGKISWYPMAISMKPDVVLVGDGKRATTILNSSAYGDIVTSVSPINSSTAARNGMRNIGMIGDNQGNYFGGNYVDIGGSFVVLDAIATWGTGNGIILDQSEVVDIKGITELGVPNLNPGTGLGGCGLWLTNNGDHIVGAASTFTNDIWVHEFNANMGNWNAVPVCDDGGYSHTYNDFYFNGGLGNVAEFRIGGVNFLKISDGWIEHNDGASGYMVDFEHTTYYGSVATTNPTNVTLDTTYWQDSNVSANPNIHVGSGVVLAGMTLTGNSFATVGAFAVGPGSQILQLTANNNTWNSTALVDTLPALAAGLDFSPAPTAIVGQAAGTARCSEAIVGGTKTASCVLGSFVNSVVPKTFTYPIPFDAPPTLLESTTGCITTFPPSSTAAVLTLPANNGAGALTCNITAQGQ